MVRSTSFTITFLSVCCAILGCALAASGQEPGPAAPAPLEEIVPSNIEGQIARIEQATGLSDDVKARVLENYRQALEQARAAADAAARRGEYRQQIEDAPALREQLERELAAPAPDYESQYRDTPLPLTELRQELTQAEAELNQARGEVQGLSDEFKRRGEMRVRIPSLIDEASASLSALDAQPYAPIEGEPAELSESRRVLSEASRAAATNRLSAYEAELANYEARSAVLALRTDVANRKVTNLERRRKALSDAIAVKTTEDAANLEARAEEQREAALEAPPEVRELAERLAQDHVALAARMTGPDGLIRLTRTVETRTREREDQIRTTREEFERIRTQEQAVGLSDDLGIILRDQRSKLPDPSELRSSIRQRTRELGEVQIERLEIDDLRRTYGVVDEAVDDLLRPVFNDHRGLSDEEQGAIRARITEQVTLGREILDELQSASEKYFDRLVNLNTEEKKYLTTTEEIRDYISKRVLWSQSDTIFVSGKRLANLAAAFTWLVDVREWLNALEELWRGAMDQPGVSGYLVLLIAALFAVQPNVRQRLRDLAVDAAKPSSTSFLITIKALGYTLLLGGWVPIILLIVAWRLPISENATEFSRALGEGLMAAAAVLLPLEILRQAARHEGLAESHFGVYAAPLRTMRRYVFAFEVVAALGVAAIVMFDSIGVRPWIESMGRAVFMVLMIAGSVFAHSLLRVPQGPLRRMVETSNPTRGGRMISWARVVAIGLLAALLFAAFLGYYYTAAHLAWRAYSTLAYFVALWLTRSMIVRWLQLTRRKLAMEQARQQREASKAKKSDGEMDALETPPAPEAKLDLALVDQQSMRLLRTALTFALIVGLWIIWVDVLPALSILEDVNISFFGLGGFAEITYAQLGLALLVVFITVVAVRNITGILEITILQRLAVGAGERNAISTIARYLITIVGAVIAFNNVGIGWEKVQWLVAALSLGLGFGLQEIFANFVSGLIILLERPVRVGDTVTVGTLHGTVSRIRIRATTITDWDNKELIVPNKEFVTGQLVNWTLTDPSIRLILPIGVAYGSDTEKVVSTLLEVAEQNERILPEPAPVALFMGFGDSTLNFELRVYSPGLDYFLKLRHDLCMAIDAAFRAKGIEIAFPQRDIHIRTIKGTLPIEDKAKAVEVVEGQSPTM